MCRARPMKRLNKCTCPVCEGAGFTVGMGTAYDETPPEYPCEACGGRGVVSKNWQPYTREDYLADRADNLISEGVLKW